MAISLGPFKYPVPGATPGEYLITGFDAALSVDETPAGLVAIMPNTQSTQVYITCSGNFQVDWGDGTPISYTTNSGYVTPTGTITLTSESSSIGSFKLDGISDTVTSISITGGGALTGTFSLDNCDGITSVTIDDISNITNIARAFRLVNCTSLTLGDGEFTSVTNGNSAFGGFARFTSLTSFTPPTFPVCTDAAYMFSGMQVTSFGVVDLPASTTYERLFEDCDELVSIAALDTTSTTRANNNMFIRCDALTSPNATIQALLESASGYDFN